MGRILLVSQHSFLRRNLAFLLEREGYQTASVAPDAALGTAVADFDPNLIILDTDVKHPGGFEICSTLAAGGIPILLVAMEARDLVVSLAKAAGAYGCLRLPADAAQIVRAIDGALSPRASR